MAAETLNPAASRVWDPQPLPVRRRRRPWLIALGALLAAVGALVVAWLVATAGQRIDVLVVRAPVAQGEALTAGMLGVAQVSVEPGVEVIPVGSLDQVTGMHAKTALAPGMLLNSGLVTADRGPETGRVLVPLAIAPDRMPSGGLMPGDRILVVDAGDAATAGAPLSGRPAVVVRVGAPDVNGVSVVDVTAAVADGPSLAITSANARVALVVQPSGS